MKVGRAHRLVMTLSLWTAVGITLWTLPTNAFPWEWIAAFTLPACLFLLLSEGLRVGVLWRLGLATVAQVGAAWLAMEYVGRLDHAAALACTLLPPMTYVALRRQDSDTALALFLSFCLHLVGVMLAGRGFDAFTAVWAIAAGSTLFLETQVQIRTGRHATVRSREPQASRIGLPILVALSCGLIALLGDRTLRLLPDPTAPSAHADLPNSERPPGLSPSLTVGPSDDFVLRSGMPMLRANELVRVRPIGRGQVPSGLYLRTASFLEPGIKDWGPGSIRTKRLPRGGAVRPRFDRANAPPTQIGIERLSAQKGILYIPAGVLNIMVDDDTYIEADLIEEWFRERDANGPLAYEAEFQDLMAVPPGAKRRLFEPRNKTEYLRVPKSVEGEPFVSLARQIRQMAADRSAVALCAAVEEFLQNRCTYDLREPTGPHDTPLENFLIGNRHGYCMHFASAAAILLRHLGVPCRIAVGLYGGDVDQDESDARMFGSQHAHAWVEIPFRDMGWVVFEPTPPDSRASGYFPDAGEDSLPTPPDEPEPEEEEDAWAWLSTVPKVIWAWAGLLAVAAVWFFRPRRRRGVLPQAAVQAWPARLVLLEILRELAKKGFPRGAGQTLEAYLRGLERHQLNGLPALQNAFSTYQDVRFGARELDPDRKETLESGLRIAQALEPRSQREEESVGGANDR